MTVSKHDTTLLLLETALTHILTHSLTHNTDAQPDTTLTHDCNLNINRSSPYNKYTHLVATNQSKPVPGTARKRCRLMTGTQVLTVW